MSIRKSKQLSPSCVVFVLCCGVVCCVVLCYGGFPSHLVELRIMCRAKRGSNVMLLLLVLSTCPEFFP